MQGKPNQLSRDGFHVYLVTNPRAPAGVLAAANWGQMTPDQREAHAQQRAQQVLAMDPASRQAALRQVMQATIPEQTIMKIVLSEMPPHEQEEFKMSLDREKERAIGGK
jgi:hypothetical protein